MSMKKEIGNPASRIDGPLKVAGKAKYAAEYFDETFYYGFVVPSAIARGRIVSLDESRALAAPGVVQVFSHKNRPNLAWFDRSYKDDDSVGGSPFRPLRDDGISFSYQPVALVVAKTFDQARYAASLIDIKYDIDRHQTDLEANLGKSKDPQSGKSGYESPPKPKGDSKKALKEAPFKIEQRYHQAAEYHNPMEMFASTVFYKDGKFNIYDKTQGVLNSKSYVSKVFGISADDVQVHTPFMGGGFGAGLRPQYQLFLAVLAARELKHSVRVTLTRQQMFSFGHRPETFQEIRLGAEASGKLTAMEHKAYAETSVFEDYTENVIGWSETLYPSENNLFEYELVHLNRFTPLDMRAPGASTGVNALEVAMDELSYQLKMDPLELRLVNYSEKDHAKNKAYSSKELRACYAQGAEKFGWSKRSPTPRSMREGRELIGYGMATGIWDHQQQKAQAKAVLHPNGKLHVASAFTDIGTGTYNVMAQVSADTLGLPLGDVSVELGSSELPQAPLQGGSWTANSIGSALYSACKEIGEKVLRLEKSPFKKKTFDEVDFRDGWIVLKEDPSQRVSLTEVLKGEQKIEVTTTETPNMIKTATLSAKTHSAVFVEVRVDEDFGMVRVTRVVSAIAAGRIINPKTARSQILGGVVWGIGMALHEEALMDHQLGRVMNHNFAEYHIPVNADVHDIDVIFVDEKDEMNPLGTKGLGEIGIIGVAAAINNAIYHATGVRVREFPITPEKALGLV